MKIQIQLRNYIHCRLGNFRFYCLEILLLSSEIPNPNNSGIGYFTITIYTFQDFILRAYFMMHKRGEKELNYGIDNIDINP